MVEADAALVTRLEQAILFRVDAWDVNCPQHLPPKFDAADVAVALRG